MQAHDLYKPVPIMVKWRYAGMPHNCPCNLSKYHSGASTHTHTHPFNGPLSGTTLVSRYQKGKTNLDFTEARDSGWQWHQLGYLQVCTSLQTDNHTSTPTLFMFFTGRMPFLPPNQQRQSTEGTSYKNSLIKKLTAGCVRTDGHNSL